MREISQLNTPNETIRLPLLPLVSHKSHPEHILSTVHLHASMLSLKKTQQKNQANS
jgi:hypothetical protein